MHVVYLEPIPPEVEAIIRSCLPDGFSLHVRGADEAPVAVAGEADFILVATTPITTEIFAAAPRLKLIQHQGVGYDNVDVEAAARAGVPVGLTPEGTSSSVAEHVILLILSLYRNLLTANQTLRQGKWLQWELRPQSYDLLGKRLGIVGLGRIGREVAQRAQAFKCRLSYYDLVRASAEVEAELGVTYTPFDDLLAQSDIITLHAWLDESTHHLINDQTIAKMRDGAILINAARGPLVDQEALARALEAGKLRGAAIDVYEKEPPDYRALLDREDVVFTPHNSGVPYEGYIRMNTWAITNFFNGA
jgi:phosphoglycerate dehydrogenase-like enzyme